jgi:hypothetical protein
MFSWRQNRTEQNIENATGMNTHKTVDYHVHCFGINIEANEMRAVLSSGIWNTWVFIEDRTGQKAEADDDDDQ